MARTESNRVRVALFGTALAGALLAGCASLAGPAQGVPAAGGKSGAELWAETCKRCHNFRSPASLSDAQWDVAMMHMRLRANLTGEEYRKILEFLKAGN